MMEGFGILFEETKRLFAFLSPFPHEAVVATNFIILLGGLTDGILGLPYAKALRNSLRKDWFLVQPLLSSSYVGYGSSSIDQDVDELLLLTKYLRSSGNGGIFRNTQRIVIIGHSTGAADVLYLQDRMKRDGQFLIDTFIMQGPVSDRLYAECHLANYSSLLQQAQEMINQGRGEEWMPREADSNAAITATRFASMMGKGTREDVFSPDLGIIPRVLSESVNVHAILSECDEYCDHFEEAKYYFTKTLGKKSCHVVKGADHAISQPRSQQEFLDIIDKIIFA